MLKLFLIFSILSLFMFLCGGEIYLHNIFTSHMVLQQKKPIIFSGTAPAGQEFLAEFAGQKHIVKADKNGQWQAEFPPMKAGFTPYSLKISVSGKVQKILSDILIGEVWLCSGQSNMEMPLKHPRNPFFSVRNSDVEVQNAKYPAIRLFTVKKATSAFTEKNIRPASWQVCTPETAASFSACGYFFGRELQKELKLPIGLISSCWGGSFIQAWLPECELQSKTPELYVDILSLKEECQNNKDSFFRQFAHMGKCLKKVLHSADNSSGSVLWQDFQTTAPLAADRIYRLKTTFFLPGSMQKKDLFLKLGRTDASKINRSGLNYVEIYLNGKKVFATALNDPHSFFWPARGKKIAAAFLKSKNTLELRLISMTGYPVFSAEQIPEISDGRKSISLKNWLICTETTFQQAIKMANFRLYNLKQPALLFNAMIAPLGVLNIRGVIWYQGEANVGNPRYYLWHKILIEGWRNHWRNMEMPFYLVQLAGFEQHRPHHPLPDDFWQKKSPVNNGSWALTREIQAEMPKLYKQVGIAVTVDVGDHSNIHPADKQTPGFRLARLALNKTYHKKLPCLGPQFVKAEFFENKVIVHFANAENGLTTSDGKMPGAFALGCRLQKKMFFVPATAKIHKNTVILTAPGLEKPETVCYAFTSYRGDVNLYNKEGFPAVPFRTNKPDYTKRYSQKGGSFYGYDQ